LPEVRVGKITYDYGLEERANLSSQLTRVTDISGGGSINKGGKGRKGKKPREEKKKKTTEEFNRGEGDSL